MPNGPAATKELSVLNLESAGNAGFHNFLQAGQNLARMFPDSRYIEARAEALSVHLDRQDRHFCFSTV